MHSLCSQANQPLRDVRHDAAHQDLQKVHGFCGTVYVHCCAAAYLNTLRVLLIVIAVAGLLPSLRCRRLAYLPCRLRIVWIVLL